MNHEEPELELDHEWMDELRCLTRDEIVDVVEHAGGLDFGHGAQRSKRKLLEEASMLEGELRQALKSAVLDKQRVSASTVRLEIRI